MSIKYKLLLIAVISTAGIMLLSVLLYFSAQSMNFAMEKNNIANHISTALFDQRLFLDEYLVHYLDRSKQQWLTVDNSLVAYVRTQAPKFSKEKEKAIIESISQAFDENRQLFLQLVTLHENRRESEMAAIIKEQETRLAGQLLVLSQALITASGQLAMISQEYATIAQNNIVYSLVGFILSLVLVVTIIVFLLWRSIIGPITKLKEGAELVGAGNLDYVVGMNRTDEIGQLSRAFDVMVRKVKDRTAELDASNQQMQAANQQLRVVNQRLDASTQQLREAQALAHLGYWHWDVKTGHVEWSDEVYKIFHLDPKTFTPHIDSVLALSPWPEDHERNKELIDRAIKSHEPGSYEQKFLRPDKSIGYYYSTFQGNYAETGELVSIVGTVVDITERKETELKLIEIDKSKTQFVSLASHQLKTPLTSIGWYSEMLMAGRVGKLTNKAHEYLEKIWHNNKRMVALVNSLLNVSRIEMGTMAVSPQSVNITEIADSVLEELSPSIKTKKFNVSTSYAKNIPVISVDPQMIRIIFQNLLSNAVKYTSRGGAISLTIEKQKEALLITFSDTGCGIPKAQQNQIFNKLFRADNARAIDTDGSGLGLYIVKAVVDQAGGKVWFDSKENKGSDFYVVLPFKGMEKKNGTTSLS